MDSTPTSMSINPINAKPNLRPKRPFFSSGPTAKFPGWTPEHLSEQGIFGQMNSRSHRSMVGRAALRQVVELSRRILGIPDSHELVIIGGSDTGAMEAAMWNLLGARPVTAAIWDRFAEDWSNEIEGLLQNPLLATSRAAPGQKFTRITAPFGTLPDLSQIDFDHDVVFAWNSTTTGGTAQKW